MSKLQDIFISYRRSHLDKARVLSQAIEKNNKGSVFFLDVDSIAPGVDWRESILSAVSSAKIILVLITADWANSFEEEHEQGDFVVYEILIGLAHSAEIIPVHYDGPHNVDWLKVPVGIKHLERKQYYVLQSGDSFNRDALELSNHCLSTLEAKEAPKLISLLQCFQKHFYIYLSSNLIAISLVSMLFIAYSEEEPLTAAGIDKYKSVSEDLLEPILERINKAKSQIWLYGFSFFKTIDGRRGQALEQAMERGVDIRIIMPDPSSSQLDTIKAALNISGDFAVEAEIKKTIVLAGKHVQEVGDAPGAIWYCLHSHSPTGRLYVFDPKDKSGSMIWIPYSVGVKPDNMPAFVSNSSSMMITNIKNGLQTTWAECQASGVVFKAGSKNVDEL